MTWWERAACYGEDTELWYPPDRYDQRGRGSPDTRTSIALSICATCPVATQCLDAAMREETTQSDRWGIRGGLTAYQRAELARQRSRRCVECGATLEARTNRITCSKECAKVRRARSWRAWYARRSSGRSYKEATA